MVAVADAVAAAKSRAGGRSRENVVRGTYAVRGKRRRTIIGESETRFTIESEMGEGVGIGSFTVEHS